MTLHFKLDENMDPQWRIPLEQEDCRVSTIAEEGLQSTDDRTLAKTCQDHALCLITADIDFAQTLEYPPEEYAGLIVLRHPNPTLKAMLGLVSQIGVAIRNESPVGCLWIVEPGRIRIHGTPSQE